MTHCRKLLAGLVVGSILGCSQGDPAAAPSPSDDSALGTPADAPEAEVGSLSLALQLQGNVFDKFSFVVTGPGFAKSGNIDVSKSNTVSVLIDSIPVGTGYSVTLGGKSAPPADAQCSGSASFDIAARQVTKVSVPVACHLDEATSPPPPVVAAAPVPRSATWILGLALLAVGLAASRARRTTFKARAS